MLWWVFFQEGDVFVQFVFCVDINERLKPSLVGLMIWNISGGEEAFLVSFFVDIVHVPCPIAIQQVCVEIKKEKYLRGRGRSLADDGRLAVSRSFPAAAAAAPKGSLSSPLSACISFIQTKPKVYRLLTYKCTPVISPNSLCAPNQCIINANTLKKRY